MYVSSTGFGWIRPAPVLAGKSQRLRSQHAQEVFYGQWLVNIRFEPNNRKIPLHFFFSFNFYSYSISLFYVLDFRIRFHVLFWMQNCTSAIWSINFLKFDVEKRTRSLILFEIYVIELVDEKCVWSDELRRCMMFVEILTAVNFSIQVETGWSSSHDVDFGNRNSMNSSWSFVPSLVTLVTRVCVCYPFFYHLQISKT